MRYVQYGSKQLCLPTWEMRACTRAYPWDPFPVCAAGADAARGEASVDQDQTAQSAAAFAVPAAEETRSSTARSGVLRPGCAAKKCGAFDVRESDGPGPCCEWNEKSTEGGEKGRALAARCRRAARDACGRGWGPVLQSVSERASEREAPSRQTGALLLALRRSVSQGSAVPIRLDAETPVPFTLPPSLARRRGSTRQRDGPTPPGAEHAAASAQPAQGPDLWWPLERAPTSTWSEGASVRLLPVASSPRPAPG